jgi:AhpD family alkylhydroperoxidase
MEKFFKEAFLHAKIIDCACIHAVQCPYCIDATGDGLKRGITKEEMMEAVHVTLIKGGAALVHGVQMMNKYNKLSM